MPYATPVYSLVVVRPAPDGEQRNYRPPIGQSFNFTQAEIDFFLSVDSRNLTIDKVRAPVLEVTSDDLGDDDDEVEQRATPAVPAVPASRAKANRPARGKGRTTAADEDEL